MPFDLILSERNGKDVGKNVFLDNLSSDYKVYILYYPGAASNESFENMLQKLGDDSGKNLFVNIGKLNDPNYYKISRKFNINNLPSVVMTAIDKFSSSPELPFTTYIRIDRNRIDSSPEETIELLYALFNLFIQGKISEATKQNNRDAIISQIKLFLASAIDTIGKIFKDKDIAISFIEGKFEIKQH